MDPQELAHYILENVFDRADLEYIREAVRTQFDMIDARDLINLKVGDEMWFTSKSSGERIEIRVTKINKKTVGGTQLRGPVGTFGSKWRVSPSLLHKIDEHEELPA